MSSTTRMIDIARRALSAQQVGLNTTSHNIANVNTPGYTRQRVDMEATTPMREVYGLVGQGVSVQSIHRIRNEFTDLEIRTEKQEYSKWEYKETFLQEIEDIFNEPSDSGLATVLRNYWDSWEELANDPQSWANREQLRQNGIHLSNTLRTLNTRLTNLQDNLNEELKIGIEEVNSLLRQIADLNVRIASTAHRGVVPNDFKDKRDLLIEQLSEWVDVRTVEGNDGLLKISLGGRTLVERETVYELGTNTRALGYLIVDDPSWTIDGKVIPIYNGKLKGLLEIRDEVIEDELDSLDMLAVSLVTEVNRLHSEGYGLDGLDGRDFFNSDTTGARDISVHADILADMLKIAASGDGSAGDGSKALEIAQLQDTKIMSGNTVSVDDFFAAIIGSLGVQSREATFMRKNQALMVEQLENQRSSTSGVSLDEEMMNIIKYQHAYEAAAKLITTIDELMETIVNMV